MRRSFPLLVNFALAAAATLLCVLVGEVLVRLFVPVRDVGPSFTMYDPRYGKVLKPGSSLRRSTPEFTMQLTTNSRGFRGPELGSLNGGSILFLGDSFTMGYGVTDGAEYPAIVRRAIGNCGPLGGLEVVNAGIGDTGTGRALRFLRNSGAMLNPRIVVLQIHTNDFDDNVKEGLYKLADSGELLELAPPPPGMARLLQRVIEIVPGLEYSHLVGLARQIRLPGTVSPETAITIEPREVVSAYEERLMLRLLGEIVQVAKQAEWRLLILLADVSSKRHDLLAGFLSGRGVTTVSIPSKAARPDLYYKVDGHWNAKGQAYAAEHVLEALRRLTALRHGGSNERNAC